MSIECEIAQRQYLQMGGVYARALATKQKTGELPTAYEYHEYPKMLRFNPREVEEVGEDIKGRATSNTRTVWDEVTVASEEEEERVLSGGKTCAQIEEERQSLLLRARAAGVKADPSWSAVRLRRELGDALDAHEPTDKLAALEDELAKLRKMAEMQREIEELRAKLAARPVDDAEELRTQLTDLGARVDGRWSLSRLREELEKATA